ncbi:MAG TPA: Crp/Fnr family transcriptional regulator [Actinomycetota bacterium]|nr:Crp/Fnr family transcriptional regulator [Actinomycetota bacterium]
MDTRTTYLLRSPILAALSPGDVAVLAERAVLKKLVRSDVLLLSGDIRPRTYLVAQGALKLIARNFEGTETVLGLVLPGDLVGDLGALDGEPQPLDAVATCSSIVASLDAEHLMELIARNRAACLAYARVLAARFRGMTRHALERSSSEVPARLAAQLLELAASIGRESGGIIEMELPIAQGELGALAGMCRESACKTLRQFKRQGVVDYRGRRLRILRRDGLERISCAERA